MSTKSILLATITLSVITAAVVGLLIARSMPDDPDVILVEDGEGVHEMSYDAFKVRAMPRVWYGDTEDNEDPFVAWGDTDFGVLYLHEGDSLEWNPVKVYDGATEMGAMYIKGIGYLDYVWATCESGETVRMECER
jgi:hypothetical protein